MNNNQYNQYNSNNSYNIQNFKTESNLIINNNTESKFSIYKFKNHKKTNSVNINNNQNTNSKRSNNFNNENAKNSNSNTQYNSTEPNSHSLDNFNKKNKGSIDNKGSKDNKDNKGSKDNNIFNAYPGHPDQHDQYEQSGKFLNKLFKKSIGKLDTKFDLYSYRKKFYLLYLIILQILSEISVDSKERSVLLYKCFKAYFTEMEKKNQLIIQNLKAKIIFYKNLIKTVMFQKDRKLDSIEILTDILKSERLTEGINIYNNIKHL